MKVNLINKFFLTVSKNSEVLLRRYDEHFRCKKLKNILDIKAFSYNILSYQYFQKAFTESTAH